MSWLNEIPLNQFLLFTLVLARLSGLVMTAPIFGAREVPVRIRALLAFALAVLITPLEAHVTVEYPASVPAYLVTVGGEMLLGLALGMGVVILFLGVQMVGQIIGMVSGMRVASIFNPSLNAQVSIFAQLLNLFAVAVFLIVGGHQMMMVAFLDLFAAVPPGQAGIPTELGDMVTMLLAQSYSLAVRAAAPPVAAVWLSNLVLGLIGRTMPQLNILAVGFGLNSMVSLGALSVTLGSIAWAFQDQIEPTLELIVRALQSAASDVYTFG